MIDDLFLKEWTLNYTCYEFSQDAWLEITGKVLKKNPKELDSPQSPCIVYLSNDERSDSHVGVFYEGKLLHLTTRGAQYIPLEYVLPSFKKVAYYQ